MNENNFDLQPAEGGEIDLRKYIDIIIRHRWVIISVTIIAVVITLLVSFTMRPVYTAKGTVMIEKEPNILSFEEIFQVETFRDDYFQTSTNSYKAAIWLKERLINSSSGKKRNFLAGNRQRLRTGRILFSGGNSLIDFLAGWK